MTDEPERNTSQNRWYACFSPDGARVYIAFATIETHRFSYVTWFDVLNEKDLVSVRDADYIIVTKSHLVNIGCINDRQVVVQDANGFAVLDVLRYRWPFQWYN